MYSVNFMWDKAYFLAFMLSGYSFIASLLLGLLGVVLPQIGGLGFAFYFIFAYVIGQLYAQKRGSVIPQSLRLWASIYDVLISGCITAIFLLAIGVTYANSLENSPGLSTILRGIGFLSVLRLMITYWGLGYGSKAYIKKTRK